jgi:DNA-binding NarL/FixJ family response regulator
VLHGVVHGWSNKEIASELAVSESTVERHVTALLHKSGCGSRLKLIAACWRGH